MGLLRRKKKQTLRSAPSYSNSMVIDRLVREEGVDRDTAHEWFDEMLVFLDMCAASDRPVSPSVPVDKAWHAFLLHTKAYEMYCQERYGRLIHHEPTPGGEKDPEAYARARRWREASGYGPMDVNVWPIAAAAVLADDGPPHFEYGGASCGGFTGGGGSGSGSDGGASCASGGGSGGGDSGGSSCGGSSCGSSCGGGS